MQRSFSLVMLGLLLAGPCLAADKVFLMTPADPKVQYPRFHVGASGIYAPIEKGLAVTVDNTEPDTPAAGKFQKGDILLKVNGKPISEPEPYIVLGEALTAAEASDGKLDFVIKRGNREESVALTLPVLGAYSRTWPLGCKKSDAIVRQAAAFLTRPENLKDPGFFGGLFLLSLGDDQYLPAVKAMVDRNSPVKASDHTWVNGYAGVLIAEYYLRTGDKSALPRLKAICVDAQERQYYGGWFHWAGPVPGYVQGGLMNPAGVQVLTTLILAKECGVEVDQGTFIRALTYFYRFAGHASVPYGDHRPEVWLSCNGKNGMLAGALSLLDGQAYQMAAQTLSLDMTDSYRWLGAGHTGGGFDVIWRGLGSVHVPKDQQDHYRRHMDKLAWYYDLCRLPKGGFSILGNAETQQTYGGPVWGHGMGLAYTAPRRTLRITGAPPAKYSQKVQAPDLLWGRPRDLEFLRTDYCQGFGREELEPHEVYDKLSDTKLADKGFFAKMLRHYNPTARTMAGLALGRLRATDEIAQALQDPDPRVRRAGLDAIENYNSFFRAAQGAFPTAVVSEKFLLAIEKILKDPEVSLWELDGALFALSRAEPADIKKNLGLVRGYVDHNEWWLRQSACAAIVALAKDEKLLAPEPPALLARVAKETHVFPRRFLMAQLQSILKDKAISSGVKEQIVTGMLQGMHEAVIEPGYLGAIGRNNKYETLRYFLEQAPEAAPQVLEEVEQLMLQPTYSIGCSWPAEYLTGDVWGNPGIIKCAEKLGKAKGAPLLARCQHVVTQLKEMKKQAQGNDVKAIEDARAAITKAIQECEKKMSGD